MCYCPTAIKVLVPWCSVAAVPFGTLIPQYTSVWLGVVLDVGFGMFKSTLVAEPVRNWQIEHEPYEKVVVAYFCAPTGMVFDPSVRLVPDT